MFGGSLVATETRPAGLLGMLRREILPDMIEDNFIRVILRAAMFAETEKYNTVPSSDALATIIVQENLFGNTPSDVSEIMTYKTGLVSAIDEYAKRGVDSSAMFNSLAAAINDHTNTKRLNAYAAQVQTMRGDTSLTATDLYEQMQEKLEQVRPDAIEARIYTVGDLRRIMAELRNERRNLLGQKLMTLPSEWWCQEYVPYLLPSLLYTITGLTGRGKSSVLQQLADHLAKCGFKVMYFHAEDDISRQIDRMARRLTYASPRELMAGDPRNKYRVVADILRDREANSHGSVTYCHCIGKNAHFIGTVTRHYRPDVIIVDYLQKLNRAAELSAAKGNDPAALANVVEQLKLVAENDQHQCVVIMGSQEAEHESGQEYRKGTSGTRQAEHKAQCIIEVERVRLNENDTPEQGGDGTVIAGPGDLSGFGYFNVVKNNDGSTGSVTCIFNGLTLEAKAVAFRQWERAHPGDNYPLPRLEEPDALYYQNHANKVALWNDLDKLYDDPKLRRRNAKKGEPAGMKVSGANSDYLTASDDDLPF